MYVGVDGYRNGWVAVRVDDAGFVGASAHPDFAGLMAEAAGAVVVGVDMPLGLVEAGARDADGAARKFLSGQASSVFSAPPRPVLAAADYEEALRLSRAAQEGKGLSKQSFHLLDKIREVDAFVAEARVYEVHPEVAFRLLHDGEPLPHRKKTYGGFRVRLRLLEEAGIALPEDLGDVNDVPADDVLDAAVVAWSARRIARGEARSFPPADEAPIQRDRSGRRIAIWG